MEKKYAVKVVSTFEFPSKDEAEAFADFRRVSEADTPECTSVEVQKLYDHKKQPA